MQVRAGNECVREFITRGGRCASIALFMSWQNRTAVEVNNNNSNHYYNSETVCSEMYSQRHEIVF